MLTAFHVYLFVSQANLPSKKDATKNVQDNLLLVLQAQIVSNLAPKDILKSILLVCNAIAIAILVTGLKLQIAYLVLWDPLLILIQEPVFQ